MPLEKRENISERICISVVLSVRAPLVTLHPSALWTITSFENATNKYLKTASRIVSNDCLAPRRTNISTRTNTSVMHRLGR